MKIIILSWTNEEQAQERVIINNFYFGDKIIFGGHQKQPQWDLYSDFDSELTDTGGRIHTMTSVKESNLQFIWLLGGPGSGKGTQAERIVKKYGYTHISTGDLLREEVNSGSERGADLSKVMKEGGLVSTDVVMELLSEKVLKELPTSKGYLIDGYPREKAQGEQFERYITSPSAIIYLEVPDDVMISRLLERAKTSGREDDNEETIKKRLQTFHDNNDPILQAFEAKVSQLNAVRSPEEIFVDVEKIIDAIALKAS